MSLKKGGGVHSWTKLYRHRQLDIYIYTPTSTRTHARTRTHTHTHTPRTRTHTHTQVRRHKHYTDCWGECSEKRNVLSLFLKEGEKQSVWHLGEGCSRCEDRNMRKSESHKFWVCVGVWVCMCLMKSGESGKGCTAAVVQKGKRGRNQWLSYIHIQAVLFLMRSEIGSQWSCCRRVVQCWWRGALRIRRAAAFWTFYIGWITELGVPMRRELQ